MIGSPFSVIPGQRAATALISTFGASPPSITTRFAAHLDRSSSHQDRQFITVESRISQELWNRGSHVSCMVGSLSFQVISIAFGAYASTALNPSRSPSPSSLPLSPVPLFIFELLFQLGNRLHALSVMAALTAQVPLQRVPTHVVPIFNQLAFYCPLF